MTETTQNSHSSGLPARSPWSHEEACRAAALWKAGATAVQIAGTLGKTRNAVLGKIGRLGLARTSNGQTRRPREGRPPVRRRQRDLARFAGPGWTPGRDARLDVLWQEGLSCDEIAVRLGSTENSIAARLTQRGLMEPECPEAFTDREWFIRNDTRFRAAMNRAVKRGVVSLPGDEVRP